jgi:hypothetical protein
MVQLTLYLKGEIVFDLRIFLDCDGVLNGHQKMSNHYSRLEPRNVENFNNLLKRFPDALIIISSSWRYLVHNGSMNLEGLQSLFLTHGLDCFKKIHGITESDEDTADSMGYPRVSFESQTKWYEWIKNYGITVRRQQIYTYAKQHEFKNFIVLDDLDLDMPELYITEGLRGLVDIDIDRITYKVKLQEIQIDLNQNKLYNSRC